MNVRRIKLSPKTAQLHQILQESLNPKDRESFTQALECYKRGQNLERFVEALDIICSTPQQKEEIYPLLREFIPRKHRPRFDYECNRPRTSYDQYVYHTYSRRQLQKSGYYNSVRSLPGKCSNPWRTLSVDSGFETPVPSSRKFETRREAGRKCAEKYVLLERDIDAGELFGFSIRGGAEHNIALFVSSIDQGSIAEKAGLCLGDQIVQVNETDFTNFYHQGAVQILQQSSTLHLFVKCVGKIPGTFKSSSSYRWIDPQGNEVSPPTEYSKSRLLRNDMDRSDLRLLGGNDERKVNLFVADGAELGLKIRGGIEHGLGIFIASVDPNSGAQRAGFQVGDQILDVNGKSFVNISHSEAVKVLKSSQHMVVTLKEVGVLPHGKKVRDETKWIKESKTSPRSADANLESTKGKNTKTKKVPSFHEPLGSSLLTHHSVADHSEEILRMKATRVLSNNELQSFSFYLEEYRKAHLSLISFLSALTDLLKTPEKMSLFQDIRSAILPQDLSKFDEWVDTSGRQLIKDAANHRTSQELDRQSLCSDKTYSSTNSWLGYFENNDQQEGLKNSSRSRFSALPYPPEEKEEHGWEVASVGSRSSRARRALPYDDFPPPPRFFQEDKDILNRSVERSPREVERTVSPSDIKLEQSFHGFSNPEGNHGGGRHVGATSCENNTMAQGRYVDIYEENNEENFTKSNMLKVKSNSTTSGGKDVTLHKDSTMWLQGCKDITDDLYTPVNHRDSMGSPGGDISTKINKTQQKTNALEKSSSSCDHPIYATVNKEKRRNTENNRDTVKNKECEDIGPLIPLRLHLEPDFIDNNTRTSKTDQMHKIEFASQQLPAPLTGDIKLNGAIPNRIDSKFKPDNPNLGKATVNNDKLHAKVSQNDANSTKRLKKSKKSKTNIAEAQHIDPDQLNEPFVIELSKHSSNLGLSIKGGTDTENKEIRIKSVKGGTVAGACPLLKPGQIILGVDEKSLLNVTSGIATMAIRQAFHSDKTVIKLILENDR